MSIPSARFYNPVKLVSGDKALDSLGFELKQLQSLRPLVITDRGVVSAGLLDHVTKALNSLEPISISVYANVPIDSSPAAVNEAAAVFRADACDSIIAVGGGSVIDTGKAVNMLVAEEVDDIRQLIGAKLRKPMKPFIAVPTTAGTGSEVTYAAMIMDPEHNKKVGFFSYLLFPNTAILDPRMTLTLPPVTTAATAMDALTHAIEAAYCTQKNPFSDAHSTMAIRLIRENLYRVVRDGTDTEGRFQLANAACMAGAAFSNAGVAMIHALGHALGGVCRVPHGIAMNIFLPYGLEFNISESGETIGELLLSVSGPDAYVQTPPAERAAKTVAAIRRLKEDLYEMTQLPRTLREAGVKEGSLAEIARAAVEDPAINFNPTAVRYADALDIVQKAY